jgi:phenylpyruvate tautomerase PptA (4-oxalocrotonate tautomerase family)
MVILAGSVAPSEQEPTMPLVRLEVRQGRSATQKQALLDAAHAALVETLGIPDHDRIQRIVEHAREDFELPPNRSDDFVLVEVTMFAGRSRQAKRRLYRALVRNFGGLGVAPADVLVVLHESPMENWGIRGGQMASEVDLGFQVQV